MKKLRVLYRASFLSGKLLTIAAATEKNGKAEIAVKNIFPYRGEGANNIFSVSKSVVSLAIGFLFDEGKVLPTDKIEKYLGKYIPEDADAGWREVTLNDLFHHKTGSGQAVDFDLFDTSSWEDKEWLCTLFLYPNVERIGKDWRYSDGNYYILGRVVRELTGKSVFAYLDEKLFSPLGFSYHVWASDPQGNGMGGSGLFLRVRDMAKLGILWKNKGTYEGKRYLSEEWITLCETPDDPTHRYGFGVRKNGKEYTITGMNGQGIWFCDDDDTVFAWQSGKGNGMAFACSLLHKLRWI